MLLANKYWNHRKPPASILPTGRANFLSLSEHGLSQWEKTLHVWRLLLFAEIVLSYPLTTGPGHAPRRDGLAGPHGVHRLPIYLKQFLSLSNDDIIGIDKVYVWQISY